MRRAGTGLGFAVVAVGVLLAGSAPPARGQVSPPWASFGQPTKAGTENVTESQLPMARAHLEGTREVWVGQAVPLVVEVIVPSWFTGAPKFPELEVPNAMTLTPEAVWNFVVQSGRQTFSAQARRYLVFPQAEGRYAVPSPKVEVSYALAGAKPSTPVMLSAPSLTFEARVPPGARDAKYFLTTDGFRISQTIDPKPAELQVGDSFTRTVTMTARNAVGMSLPPLKFEVPDGIRLYPGTPRVVEAAERGKVEATRTEKASYVAEKEGHYRLPEITILWWNPRTRAMNRASVPAVELNVRGRAADSPEVFSTSQAEEERPKEERTDYRKLLAAALRWTLLLLAAFLLLLVARRVLSLKGLSLATWLAGRRKRRAEAETTWFRRFKKASLSQDPGAALRHLMLWLDRADTGPSVPLLKQFAAGSGVPELAERAGDLNDLLFARRTGAGQDEARRAWRGRRFYQDVARARKLRLDAERRAMAARHPKAENGPSSLAPRLNPDS